jgi:hypothetical protein
MECQACQIIHVVGPYVLVVFFAFFLYRLIRRHHEHLAQLHARTMDVFERQNATYERVHFDLVAMKKNEAKDVVETDVAAPKRR